MTQTLENKGKLLMLSTILTSTLILNPAYAETRGVSEPSNTNVKQSVSTEMEQERHLIHETHKMVGYVNLAAMALDLDLADEAKADIEKAKVIANTLEKETFQLDLSGKVKYGKLAYDYKDTIKDYYVPLYDEVFVLDDYEVKPKGNDVDIDEIDAEIVHGKMELDLRHIKSALDKALDHVNAGKNTEARKALVGIYEGAMTESSAIEDPLWAAHDNIMLAENMAQKGEYNHARFALRHASQQLKRYEQENPGTEQEQYVQKLDSEISTVQAQLNRHTFTGKMKETMSGWRKTLKGHIQKDKDAK